MSISQCLRHSKSGSSMLDGMNIEIEMPPPPDYLYTPDLMFLQFFLFWVLVGSPPSGGRRIDDQQATDRQTDSNGAFSGSHVGTR